MPHDKNGKLVKEGDPVVIRARVKQVYGSDDYCNCNVTLVEPMHPGTSEVGLTINTKQCEKVED